MTSKYMVGVPYIEGDDFTQDKKLKSYVTNNKPLLLMVQGVFCGYCTQAKPAFAALLNNPKFGIATIQTDGGDTDKMASQIMNSIKASPGVPSFFVFGPDGSYLKDYQGNRTKEAFLNFMSQL